MRQGEHAPAGQKHSPVRPGGRYAEFHRFLARGDGAYLHGVGIHLSNPKTTATIVGWGMAVPAQIRTNADLEALVDTSDEWIVERTGIRERRIAADNETTFTLGQAAAERALAVAGLRGTDVDLVIVATLTPEFAFPATASLIQDAIGARDAGAFDLNAACTGFVYGLAVARGMIESGMHRTVLLVGSDVMSRIIDWSDRATCVLFGDGAGAVVMQAADRPGGVLSTTLGSDGSGADLLCVPAGGSRRPASEATLRAGLHYVRMNGREVYKFAVNVMSRAAGHAISLAGLGPEDIDLFIPHQANVRIIRSASAALGVPESRVFVNVQRYGNTSAGSIPIALCEAIEAGRLAPGDRLVLVGFGGGLTWAAAALQWTAPVPLTAVAAQRAAAEVGSTGG